MSLNRECVNDYITEKCVEFFQSDQNMQPVEMADCLMDHPAMDMHCVEHHYLIPAVLLTASRKKQGQSLEQLQSDLKTAGNRAKNVLGGFCGFYGCCGAAVGVGIYLSILLNTNPRSVESWSLVNLATARSLFDISQIEGPRCCKRNTYLAISSAVPLVKEKLGLDLGNIPEIACHHYPQNTDCKREKCPFFPLAKHPEIPHAQGRIHLADEQNLNK